MKWLATLLIIPSLLCSCALQSTQPPLKWICPSPFSKTIQMVEQKDITGATKELESILAGPPSQGVSDEALYRLALIRLNENNGDDQHQKALQLLDLLVKAFPTSQWAYMAKPLIGMVNNEDNLTKQIRSLKSTVSTQAKEGSELKAQKTSLQQLQKENRELKQRLERLKELDIQLEQKSR